MQLVVAGQVHTGVKGFVVDANRNPLQGATIWARNVTSAERPFVIKHTVTSSEDGDFFRLLTPGRYELTAQLDGFQPLTKVQALLLLPVDERRVEKGGGAGGGGGERGRERGPDHRLHPPLRQREGGHA